MKEKSDLTAEQILKNKLYNPFYEVDVKCDNCQWKGILVVQKGQYPDNHCPNCKMKTLRQYKRRGGKYDWRGDSY